MASSIQGLDEVLRKMRLLPERIGRNAMRRSLRKGANIIRDAARNNAKRIDDAYTRQQIWKNIAVAGGGAKREKQIGGVMMRVGVRGGAKQYVKNKENVRKRRAGTSYETGGSSGNPGGDTWYWRLVEFGTSKMRAQPFLTPAGAEKATAAVNAIVADLNVQIDKEIRKL